MNKDWCQKHDRDTKTCEQCKIESWSDEELLERVETYAADTVACGFICRGWWIELAIRLRAKLNEIKSLTTHSQI